MITPIYNLLKTFKLSIMKRNLKIAIAIWLLMLICAIGATVYMNTPLMKICTITEYILLIPALYFIFKK